VLVARSGGAMLEITVNIWRMLCGRSTSDIQPSGLRIQPTSEGRYFDRGTAENARACERRVGQSLRSVANSFVIEHFPDCAVSGSGRVPLVVEEVGVGVRAGRYLLWAKRAVGARRCCVR
jgi:hypothetical protein